jgi:peptidoglycan/LPS O-acetylase OafA/YrhL
MKTNHFLALDGLRGLVAVLVMLHHYFLFNGMKFLLPRGYLGVDFFFVLSGFVIAHAYEDKLKQKGFLATFCLQRAIRLAPMIFLSVTLAYLFSTNRADIYAYLLNLFVIPNFLDEEGRLFPINLASWSLFYEVSINFFYAIFILYIVKIRAILLMILSASILFVFLLKLRSVSYVGTSQDSFIAGFFRVSFSFYAGVLLWRIKDINTVFKDINVIYLCLLMVIITSVPKFRSYSTLYDLFIIFFVCPMIVFVGSKIRLSNNYISYICKMSGEISYPLYLIHIPIQILISPHLTGLTTFEKIVFCVPLSGLSILASFLILKAYDAPVRSYLSRYFRKKTDMAVKPT